MKAKDNTSLKHPHRKVEPIACYENKMKLFFTLLVTIIVAAFVMADGDLQQSGTPTGHELDRFLPPPDMENEDEALSDEYRYERDSTGSVVQVLYIGTKIGKCDPQRTRKIRCKKSGLFFDTI